MKELIVLAKDRIGLLADLAGLLGQANVNIESISADTMGGKAVIHLIVSDYKLGKETLEKGDFIVADSDMIVVKILNRPGELAKLARKLANAKIKMKHGQLLSTEGNIGLYAVKVDNPKKAAKVLKDYM